MDFTVQVSKAFGISPFNVLDEEKDKVIMMINYFIEKGEDEGQTETIQKRTTDKQTRIRVTDDTATGGWY